MHAYTQFLLEDLNNAHRPLDYFQRKKKISNREELKNKLEESENFLNYPESIVFKDYCGLKPEDFPPGENLEKDDLNALTKAMVKMYESWNILVDLPDNLPAEFAYRLVISLLDRGMPIMQYGFFGMDYCTGNPEGCEFKEYCTCLKYWEEK